MTFLLAMASIVIGFITYDKAKATYANFRHKELAEQRNGETEVKFAIAVIAIVMGLMVFNSSKAAYADYRHNEIVKQCKSQIRNPKGSEDLINRFCEKWAK